MKKALSILLSILLLMSAVPLGVLPAISVSAATTSGTTGDCTWTLDEDGHLTISGNGAMGDYGYATGPWGTRITSITIEDGVTSIGNGAIYYCVFLTSVTIPDSVTTIGNDAFSYCYNLTSVTIPDSVTSIGEFAFFECYRLTSVDIPASVATIGNRAFSGCSALTAIHVSPANSHYSSVDGVLFNKDKTTLVQYPGGIGGDYTIPAGVTTIGEDAFGYCASLEKVTIGDSVTTIEDAAFCGCNTLFTAMIGDGVTSIGEYAFYGCNKLGSVTIGASVTTIGKGAFSYCDALWNIHYHGTAQDKAAISIDSSDAVLTHNATWHYYDNACDRWCNECNSSRQVPAHVYDNACDTDCNKCGAVRGVGDHVYNDDKDSDCNVCGAVRAVADCVGMSVSEDVSGLAMLFKPEVEGVVEKSDAFMQADYTNATYHGYKLLELGVVASNGVCQTTIKGEYIYEWKDGMPTFAFRIIDIPADKLDVVITMTPYYVVEIDGVETTIYGTAQTGAYADIANES